MNHESMGAAVGRRLELDGEEVVFPPKTRVDLVEKMLVRNPEVRSCGCFVVKSVLNPTWSDGKYIGRAHSGMLKIIYTGADPARQMGASQ